MSQSIICYRVNIGVCTKVIFRRSSRVYGLENSSFSTYCSSLTRKTLLGDAWKAHEKPAHAIHYFARQICFGQGGILYFYGRTRLQLFAFVSFYLRRLFMNGRYLWRASQVIFRINISCDVSKANSHNVSLNFIRIFHKPVAGKGA